LPSEPRILVRSLAEEDGVEWELLEDLEEEEEEEEEGFEVEEEGLEEEEHLDCCVLEEAFPF